MFLPYWLVVVLLGVIEGITEFIPISSTGHLLIAEHLLKLDPQSFLRSDLFNVVIQAGAVLAVLPLFKDRLAMLTRWREPASQTLIAKIATAFFITCVGGFIIDKKGIKLPEQATPIALALLIGGVLFIAVEMFLRGKKGATQISWNVAIAVGLAQLLAAVFPGASRSGSTILFALVLGAARPLATEFSFLVGIPTMLAASALKIFKALHHPAPGSPSPDWAVLVVASVIAAAVSFVAVKWLLRYVQSHTFVGFGIYRIAVGVFLLLLASFHLI
ncbi:MAG: undecaprenyl-diphosphate phosphatase [Chthoniobacterales bacterium]